MTNDLMTCPSEAHCFVDDEPQDEIITSVEDNSNGPDDISSSTAIARFSEISHLLSSKDIRRPRQSIPANKELKRLAKSHRPPADWYESEEEKPF